MSAQESIAAPRRRLTLDIDVGVEPLSGVVYADGVAYPFQGWMALASQLGRLTDPGMQAQVKDEEGVRHR